MTSTEIDSSRSAAAGVVSVKDLIQSRGKWWNRSSGNDNHKCAGQLTPADAGLVDRSAVSFDRPCDSCNAPSGPADAGLTLTEWTPHSGACASCPFPNVARSPCPHRPSEPTRPAACPRGHAAVLDPAGGVHARTVGCPVPFTGTRDGSRTDSVSVGSQRERRAEAHGTWRATHGPVQDRSGATRHGRGASSSAASSARSAAIRRPISSRTPSGTSGTRR